MANLNYHPHRSDAEWYRIIMDCRKSGMTDTQYCHINGIAASSFWSAVKRLRKKSFVIPESADPDIHDLTLSRQDVFTYDRDKSWRNTYLSLQRS